MSTVLVTRTRSLSLSSYPGPAPGLPYVPPSLLGQSLTHTITLLFYNRSQVFSEHAQGTWLMLTLGPCLEEASAQ